MLLFINEKLIFQNLFVLGVCVLRIALSFDINALSIYFSWYFEVYFHAINRFKQYCIFYLFTFILVDCFDLSSRNRYNQRYCFLNYYFFQFQFYRMKYQASQFFSELYFKCFSDTFIAQHIITTFFSRVSKSIRVVFHLALWARSD